MASWPVNADGTQKKFGQLSKDEQMAQLRIVCDRLKAEFEDPDHQRRVAEALEIRRTQNPLTR